MESTRGGGEGNRGERGGEGSVDRRAAKPSSRGRKEHSTAYDLVFFLLLSDVARIAAVDDLTGGLKVGEVDLEVVTSPHLTIEREVMEQLQVGLNVL